MFEFAEATKDMTAAEILNYYRNLFYAEPQVTERGIVANAINDYFQEVAPRAELDEVVYKLECLLCHATGSKLSKHTYDLKTMETNVTDYINESYSEGYEEGKADVAREIFEGIEKYNRPPLPECEPVYIIKASELDELKKKYTEANHETQG